MNHIMKTVMKQIKIPSDLIKMNTIFAAQGYEAFLVGGAVRDMLLGKPATDWDIATSATPQEVMALFRKVIPTGIEHGTVTVHFMGHEIEVTTYRTDIGYSDGRHPDKIAYAATIQDDLSRRDFTMNAIAVNMLSGEVTDPFNGRRDIKHKIIRSVGNPVDRFTEDGLRPIRALRFSAQLGFVIEKKTFEAISDPAVRKITAGISIERFRDELIKMLQAPAPSIGLHFMEQTGVLMFFIPEFGPCRGCMQADSRGFHEFDVMDHLFYACDGAPADNLVVRLAALFHDIGKPAVKETEDTGSGTVQLTFYNHETVSAEIVHKVLIRLRFPNTITDAVTHLVKQHMFHYEENWSDAAVRRFLVRVHTDLVDDLFSLRIADIYGMHHIPVCIHDSEVGKNLCALHDRIKKILDEKTALHISDLAVNGSDLKKAGIPAGPLMGKILQQLLDIVIEDPEQNTKESLLKIAKNYAAM